jgi:hypothetical protein
MTYLIQFLQQALAWLLQFVDWILTEVFSVICAAVLAVINAIPVPSFFATAGSFMAALPPGVVYFSQGLDLRTGFTILFSAIGLRFLIRRLPYEQMGIVSRRFGVDRHLRLVRAVAAAQADQAHAPARASGSWMRRVRVLGWLFLLVALGSLWLRYQRYEHPRYDERPQHGEYAERAR